MSSRRYTLSVTPGNVLKGPESPCKESREDEHEEAGDDEESTTGEGLDAKSSILQSPERAHIKQRTLGSSYKEALCSKCSKGECVTHLAVPCRCFSVCKSCAMRMATGGRCKLCHDFFVGFKLILPSAKETQED